MENETETKMTPERKDFLLAMYKELFNNIDRHISLSWQSISIIASFIAAVMFTEKYHLSSFITVTFLVIVIAWTIARLIDAEHWYERNIHIISNIEKLFLTSKDDDINVHFYFTKNRTERNRLDSVVIQIYGASLLWILALLYLIWRIPKNIEEKIVFFTVYIDVCLVFMLSIVFVILLVLYREKNIKGIKELRENSPGLNILE